MINNKLIVNQLRLFTVIVVAIMLFFGASFNDSFLYAQGLLGRSAQGDSVRVEQISKYSKRIDNTVSAKVTKTAILVDGKPIAFCANRKEAKQVLILLKHKYSDNNATLKSIDFVENVTIEKAKVALDDFRGYPSTEELLAYIEKGNAEDKTYTVQAGDTFSSISTKTGLTVEEIILANPQLAKQKFLSEGQSISVVVPDSLIHVKTVDTISYEKETDFEVVEEGTDRLFEGEFDIKVKGEKGKSSYVAERVLINGVEASREIISETVITEPKTQVLKVGTKKAPPKKGTGFFVRPARSYVITSPFGERRSYGIHTGIDLAMPIGRDITAADGGVVTFASYRGTYGYLVIIDHGDRKKTYYAHCSELLVKPGDKVFQGQRVALSGNSGRSTGPHLHFEVRIDDVPVNPIDHVKLK